MSLRFIYLHCFSLKNRLFLVLSSFSAHRCDWTSHLSRFPAGQSMFPAAETTLDDWGRTLEVTEMHTDEAPGSFNLMLMSLDNVEISLYLTEIALDVREISVYFINF